MLPIAHRSASPLRSRVVRAVGAELAIVAIRQRDRAHVVGSHKAEREKALRPAARENDALVEREKSLDALREEVLHGEELAREVSAGTDRKKGGGVNAMVVGGREIQRGGVEAASLVCEEGKKRKRNSYRELRSRGKWGCCSEHL